MIPNRCAHVSAMRAQQNFSTSTSDGARAGRNCRPGAGQHRGIAARTAWKRGHAVVVGTPPLEPRARPVTHDENDLFLKKIDEMRLHGPHTLAVQLSLAGASPDDALMSP
jgi:hypothetical protein